MFDQGAGVDQIGGAKINTSDFTDDQTKREVGVTSERRQEKIGFKLEIAKMEHEREVWMS